MLQKLRVEPLKRLLKRIRLGTGNGAFDDCRLHAGSGELPLQELDGVAQTPGIVASEGPEKGHGGIAILGKFFRVFVNRDLNLVLRLQPGQDVADKLGRLQELDQERASREDEFVLVWDHALQHHQHQEE